MSKVLVVAVHPDDETLGCGGTLLKHKSAGDELYWLIATTISKEQGFPEQEILNREKIIEKVFKTYKFNKLYNLSIHTTKVDQEPMNTLIKMLTNVFSEVQPDIIYLPFAFDIHSDHRIIFDASFSCTKSFRFPFIKRLLMMETISETEYTPPFQCRQYCPNVFVDISPFFEKKLEIMSLYRSEMKNHPFPRSIENIKALAILRGAQAYCNYAESFVLLKEFV